MGQDTWPKDGMVETPKTHSRYLIKSMIPLPLETVVAAGAVREGQGSVPTTASPPGSLFPRVERRLLMYFVFYPTTP